MYRAVRGYAAALGANAGLVGAGILLSVLVSAIEGRAQHIGEPGAAHLRVVWEAEVSKLLGPIVQGSVYNESIYAVRHVQLRIQALDASNAVTEETYRFVLGDIAPGSRAYFVARVPAADRYRVSVLSFERIGGGI